MLNRIPYCLIPLLGAAALTVASPVIAADAGSTRTAAARELVDTWVSIEQQRSNMEQNWAEQEQQLALRLQLLGDEKAELTRTLQNRTEATDEVEEERASLLAQQTTLESDQMALAESIEVALVSLRTLLPQLPPPLADAWRQALDSSAFNPDDNSQVLQLILDLSGQLNDFQNTMTLHEGLIDQPDGSRLMVRQLFMGSSQGWYVSEDGAIGGTGHPSPEGWQWREDPALQPATVLRAIRMIENNQDVGLLELPIQIASPTLSSPATLSQVPRP